MCSWPSVPKDWSPGDCRLPYGKLESLTSVLKPSELTAHEMVEAVSVVENMVIPGGLGAGHPNMHN